MTLHLTRAVLDRDATAAALAPLLDPPEPSRALDAHHRLIWTLFPGKDAVRDFLWRADGRGRFFILSHRAPVQSDLFRPLDTTDFDPILAQGDRLFFSLRANATKDRRVPKDKNGRRPNRRVDLVMDALHSTPGRQFSDRIESATDPPCGWRSPNGLQRTGSLLRGGEMVLRQNACASRTTLFANFLAAVGTALLSACSN